MIYLLEDDITQQKRIKQYIQHIHTFTSPANLLSAVLKDKTPKIILLDEPLTSFDVVVANEMKHLLLEMKEEHILIFSTHILQLARDLCDEIVLLHNGVLEQLDHDLLQQNDFEDRFTAAGGSKACWVIFCCCFGFG